MLLCGFGFPRHVLFVLSSPSQQYPALRRIAKACLPIGDGPDARRVVDAGCGTGALAGFLKEAGVEERDIVGVDMASEVGYDEIRDSLHTSSFARGKVWKPILRQVLIVCVLCWADF